MTVSKLSRRSFKLSTERQARAHQQQHHHVTRGPHDHQMLFKILSATPLALSVFCHKYNNTSSNWKVRKSF